MSSVLNNPDIWSDQIPRPKPDGHKYDRGHALIFGAPELTGATRLASQACSRIGAGLVTVLAESNAEFYRTVLAADIMVRTGESSQLKGVTGMLGGSGGISSSHLSDLLECSSDCVRVVDADAILPKGKLPKLDSNCILTPHDGEFKRAFGGLDGTREERAAQVANASGAVIVLKGPETIIANPDGRIVVNRHASPWLAKAGTGDVLAGLICGLAVQGMPPFEAACAAAWIHGEAGIRIGPGLVASDLEKEVPAILSGLLY